mmetsp:Transcript_160630/g.515602  ORF Transcript_160630/g.515602 Transcript_160630/m.515602 type:complete len:206 (+) Transcript_160630:332-949(+)
MFGDGARAGSGAAIPCQAARGPCGRKRRFHRHDGQLALDQVEILLDLPHHRPHLTVPFLALAAVREDVFLGLVHARPDRQLLTLAAVPLLLQHALHVQHHSFFTALPQLRLFLQGCQHLRSEVLLLLLPGHQHRRTLGDQLAPYLVPRGGPRHLLEGLARGHRRRRRLRRRRLRRRRGCLAGGGDVGAEVGGREVAGGLAARKLV